MTGQQCHGLRALCACLGLGVLLAACGGGSPPGVANLRATGHSHIPSSSGGSPTPSGGGPSSGGHSQSEAQIKMVGASAKQEVRYAQCMRASGEPTFPDPNSQGAFTFGSAQGIDPRSSQFQAAQQKCSKYVPQHRASPGQQQRDLRNLVAYSQCMRRHGVTSFPDPTLSGGGVSLSLGRAIDHNSPVFVRAQQACGGLAGAPPPLNGGGK